MELYYGFISEVDADTGMAKVKLPILGEDFATDWLPLVQKKTKEDQDWYLPDINEHVTVIMDADCEDGIILGAIYSERDKPKRGSADTWSKTFKDGTYIEYDRSSHELKVDNDGHDVKVILNGGGNNGLLIRDKSVERWNKIEQDINNLKTIMSSWVPVPNDGGAALKSAAATWAGQPLQQTQGAMVENTNVKH